jgi:hypothetical protein
MEEDFRRGRLSNTALLEGMQNENRRKEEKEAEKKHQRIAIEGGRDKPDPGLFRINQNLLKLIKT